MKSNYSVTYAAPEDDQNWGNWYVLSGIGFGTEFYFRRWYLDDSVVSMEFRYPKQLTPLFDDIVATITHKLELQRSTNFAAAIVGLETRIIATTSCVGGNCWTNSRPSDQWT